MHRFVHLCLIVGAIAIASCRNASQPLSLGSDAQASIPSTFPADLSQLLVGADELIVQTAGEWTTRQENGVEIREPSGYGTHSVQVVAINGKQQTTTPPVTVFVGGEVVVAPALCFVSVRDHGQWRLGASLSTTLPTLAATAAPLAGCDGVYSNTTSVVWTTPPSGSSCWGDLNFNVDTGGWSRSCVQPSANTDCQARVNFADGTHKDVTFDCNATPPGGFRGNGSTVSINGSTGCN